MAEDNKEGEKSGRIGMLCVTIAFLGLLLFLTKTNACALACNSCNSPSKPDICKDEFYEIDNNSRYGNSHSCTPGARVEVVPATSATKAGIICHCINSEQDAGATPPQAK